MVTFYITAQDATRVQLRRQIANETACLKDISQQIEQLIASLGRQEAKPEAVAGFVCLSEETIQRLEEILAFSLDELRQRQQYCINAACAKEEKLKSNKREAEMQLQASRAKLAPLEQQLALRAS